MTNKNILVVSAHADDIEIGMAMQIYDYVQRNHNVYEVILSGGELGGNPIVRKKEAEKAAEILGISKVWFYEHPNTRFDEVRPDILKSIEERVNQVRPDIVFGPWPDDEHIDHSVTGREILAAARSVPTIIYYECLRSQKFIPNHAFFQGQKYMDKKLEAVKCHESQIQRNGFSVDYIEDAGKYWANRFVHPRCVERIKNDLGLSSADKLHAEVFHIHRSLNI